MTKNLRVVLVLLLVGTLSGCGVGPLESVPDELVGVWKTTTSNYQNRFFEITKDLVVFGTGGGNAEAYRISSITEVRENEKLLYTISYASAEGDEYGFFFYYDPAGGGVIRFKNQQQMAWTNIGRPLSVPSLIRTLEDPFGRDEERAEGDDGPDNAGTETSPPDQERR